MGELYPEVRIIVVSVRNKFYSCYRSVALGLVRAVAGEEEGTGKGVVVWVVGLASCAEVAADP